MARRLSTDKEIDNFVVKVINEAIHHASAVERVIKPLSDAVRKRIDLSNDSVEVYERNGQLARTCWVTLDGKRYVFSYNYGTKKIELRSGTLRGRTLFSFDNATSQSNIVGQVVKL
ncbi:MAG: hypothetical protein COA37_10150 [Hoeflea sp.]|uniref:hypothetical protein n=1 Tax=Hoeflea sp. TaxID=1940281 RepID=UPI000C0FABCF|nr:hypothetical protein [Hoeflea sp.]PHR23062.1 MAG: hypothetical protein COA37_10150 [Hoeflea sp.]